MVMLQALKHKGNAVGLSSMANGTLGKPLNKAMQARFSFLPLCLDPIAMVFCS